MTAVETPATVRLGWKSRLILVGGTTLGVLVPASAAIALALLDGAVAYLEAGGTFGGYGAAATPGAATPSPVLSETTWKSIVVLTALGGGVASYAILSMLLIRRQRHADTH